MVQEDPVYEVLRALETIKLYKEFYFAGATQNSASTSSASSSQSVFSSDTFSYIYSQNVILPDFTDVSLGGDRTVEGNIIPHGLSPPPNLLLRNGYCQLYSREPESNTWAIARTIHRGRKYFHHIR